MTSLPVRIFQRSPSSGNSDEAVSGGDVDGRRVARIVVQRVDERMVVAGVLPLA